MLTFKQKWEEEVEQQRKDYYNRIGDHSYSSPPLRPTTRPTSIPYPVTTQAWSEVSGMSSIFAKECYESEVKAQQDVYTGKSHKRFMDAIDKLERFRGFVTVAQLPRLSYTHFSSFDEEQNKQQGHIPREGELWLTWCVGQPLGCAPWFQRSKGKETSHLL